MLVGKMLKIRILQFWRTIWEWGIIRTFFLVGIILFIFLYIHSHISHSPYDYLLPVLVLTGIFGINQKRKDHFFLQKIIPHPQWIIFAEYIFITSPLWIELLVHQKFTIVFLFYVILFFISQKKWNISLKTNLFFNLAFIPSPMFEWKSGIRRNLFFLPFIGILVLGGLYHIYFSFFAFIFCQIMVMSFYDYCESRDILEVQGMSAGKFLKKKLIIHTGTMLKFLLPLILVSLIHYEYIVYIMWCLVVIIHSLVFAILIKYASYIPGYKITITLSIAILLALGSLVPYVFIFVFLLNCFLFIKAKQNLNVYLYDYN